MTLSEMRRLLDARGIQLTKSLGQNFLHDANQLGRIAEAADLSKEDRVLEVGPGLGPLTSFLVRAAGTVLAVEKDARLVACLQERFKGANNLHLLHTDALDLARPGAIESGASPCVAAFRAHMLQAAPTAVATGAPDGARLPFGCDWKLVSNLPYSVASPLMVDLAWSPFRPARMVVTLQLEVVRRLAAAPRTPEYGALTLLMQLDYAVSAWFKVPAGCFFPVPDVDSACVVLARRPLPLLDASLRGTFRRLVKTGFSQRRKMMLKLLKQHWPVEQLRAASDLCGISAQARAEELGLEQFVQLAKTLEMKGKE